MKAFFIVYKFDFLLEVCYNIQLIILITRKSMVLLKNKLLVLLLIPFFVFAKGGGGDRGSPRRVPLWKNGSGIQNDTVGCLPKERTRLSCRNRSLCSWDWYPWREDGDSFGLPPDDEDLHPQMWKDCPSQRQRSGHTVAQPRRPILHFRNRKSSRTTTGNEQHQQRAHRESQFWSVHESDKPLK